jgi:hypothetical protein
VWTVRGCPSATTDWWSELGFRSAPRNVVSGCAYRDAERCCASVAEPWGRRVSRETSPIPEKMSPSRRSLVRVSRVLPSIVARSPSASTALCQVAVAEASRSPPNSPAVLPDRVAGGGEGQGSRGVGTHRVGVPGVAGNLHRPPPSQGCGEGPSAVSKYRIFRSRVRWCVYWKGCFPHPNRHCFT